MTYLRDRPELEAKTRSGLRESFKRRSPEAAAIRAMRQLLKGKAK